MPELPEVQTTVNGINRHATGRAIKSVWSDYQSAFHLGKDNINDPDFWKRFQKTVVGATITSATRRAKNVLIHLDNGHTIIIHMKMTGHVLYGKYEKRESKKIGKLESEKGERKNEWVATAKGPLRDDPFNRHLRLVFSLSDGKCLVLSDLRRFAKVTMAETESLYLSLHLRASGPEPLEDAFDLPAFVACLQQRSKGPIKTVLMDHQVIAGIGNIYSDEILWRAAVHPLEKVKDVPKAKIAVMFRAMKETLNKGIDFGGDSMSDYRNILGEAGKFQERHKAYRKTGKRCSKPRCPGTITRLKVGGRSAHFCDTHQRLSRSSSRT